MRSESDHARTDHEFKTAIITSAVVVGTDGVTRYTVSKNDINQLWAAVACMQKRAGSTFPQLLQHCAGALKALQKDVVSHTSEKT